MPTVAIVILKSSKNGKGETPVYCRYTQYGRPKYISTGKSVPVKDWKPNKSSYMRKGSTNAARLNLYFSAELTRAKRIIINLENNGTPVTFDNFKAHFKPLDDKIFSDLASEYLKKRQEKPKGDSDHLSDGSARLYNFAIKSLEDFAGKEVRIKEITNRLLKTLWETLKKNHSESTANSYLRSLKAVYNGIVKDFGIKDTQPFNGIHTKSLLPDKKRDDLSYAEINLLNRYLDEHINEGVFHTKTNESHSIRMKAIDYDELRKYLFMVETSLSLSDANDLNRSHIKIFDFEDEKYYYIKKNRIKTNKKIVSPLSARALELIGYAINWTDQQKKIFHHSESGNMMSRMKKWSELSGINKNITSHTARHTFAERSREKEMDIDQIAKSLGDTRKTTEKYYLKDDDTILLKKFITFYNMRKPTQYNKKTNLQMELLRENMKTLREKKNLRPVDVHERIGKEGISLSQYCKYEKGESQMSLAFIIDWCNVMGVTLGELEAGKF